jgi:phosphoserine phosphatase
MYGDRKASAIESFVEANNFDLKTAWAYGDHSSDQPLLSMVGHPVAVNPTPALRRIAQRNQWPVLDLK